MSALEDFSDSIEEIEMVQRSLDVPKTVRKRENGVTRKRGHDILRYRV
jgi:hypothetical protein